jgi:hypothetical protein
MSKSDLIPETEERRLAYCREHTPELVLLRAALIPFSDVIDVEYAYPQGESDEEDKYVIGTYRPDDSQATVWFEIYHNRIETYCTIRDEDGEEYACDPPVRISLTGMCDYLRHLPRPFFSFASENR